MPEVVTRLVVAADGSLRTLDQFEQGMEQAGRATDYTTGAIADFQQRMDTARAAMERGNAISTQSVQRKTAEQRAWEKWSATVDKTSALRIRLEREAANASVAAANAVVAGYATQEQALMTLMALEQRHAAMLTASMGATRRSADMNRNLMFQMVDIGQALATAPTMGIYALQNLGFQFAQIGQMYYGQGGMGAALKDMSSMLGGAVSRMGPLIAVTAVAAMGLAGLTYEFNKTAETAVNMGDVALAGFELLGEGIAAAVMPAVNQVVTWLQNLWDWIAPGLKVAGNGIVGTFVFAYEAALASWSSLPTAMGDVIITTANVIVAGVEEAINHAAELIDAFINKANENLGQFGLAIPNVGRVSFGGFSNPFSGAGRDYQDALNTARDSAFGRDYLGDLGGEWSERAQQNARERLAKEAEGGAGGGLNAYEQATKRIREQTLALQDQQSAIGLTEEATARFTTAMELLRAAEEAKLPITSGLIDEINRLADAYAIADEQARQMEMARELVMETESPIRQWQDEIAGLNLLLDQGAISWQAYGAAMVQSSAGAANSVLGSLSQITATLAGAFENNKALAVANAVVNTAEGVTKALAQGGIFAWPMAAAIAAAGAAQIGTILSAKPGSSNRPSVGGAGGGAAAAPVAPAEPSRTINLTLGGNGRYSRDEVRDLLEQFTDELNDGAGTKFKMAVNG